MNTQNDFQSIGRYQITKSLGKGGMGEVLLGHDPVINRHVAIKIIRKDLLKFNKIRRRFLKEAKIAGQLTHPSIIPIYTIHHETDELYYTMPYVEGETLKEIVHITKTREEKGEKPHPIGVSIPALIRIFINVCQAVSYAHSKNIIHRDLKPENIIVGKYGEVLILDWGIAVHKNAVEESSDEPISPMNIELTQPGKVLGTLSYLAPERVKGSKATESTDVYSLGVLLYFILTLELPFKRKSLKDFKKSMALEYLIEPNERAPYREIPRQLSEITKKALSFDPKDRYDSVKQLINDLEHYIEGNPEWIFAKSFDIIQKNDWEFQENILLAKHTAITRSSKIMEWALLMISSKSFSGNIKIEIEINAQEITEGIGILMNIPDSHERKELQEGYRFWMNAEPDPHVKLFRSNIEVMHIGDIGLKAGKQSITVEKIENHVRLFIDDQLILNYVSYLPMVGSHIGFLCKDMFFTLHQFNIFEGSQNIMVNCLSVPDAFLATKSLDKALVEYQRIGYSFQGRAEGREALFRAGFCLINKAKLEKREYVKKKYLADASTEFEKLRASPGAPLEYLGKSLVYQQEKDVEEEIKCLELALRKYPRHPLGHILEEHIIFRLHQTATRDRIGAYHFTLLALRLIPHIFTLEDTKNLLQNLEKYKEKLFFIDDSIDVDSPNIKRIQLVIELSFWVNKPMFLMEIYQNHLPNIPQRTLILQNILAVFHALNREDLASQMIASESQLKDSDILRLFNDSPEKLLMRKIGSDSNFDLRLSLITVYKHLTPRDYKKILPLMEQILSYPANEPLQEHIDFLHTWVLLLQKKFQEAWAILEKYSLEHLHAFSPLSQLYGLYLWFVEGKEFALIYFESFTDITFPYTHELLSQYLRGKIKLKRGWGKKAFLWEKFALCQQLTLYYSLIGNQSKAKYFEKKAKELLT